MSVVPACPEARLQHGNSSACPVILRESARTIGHRNDDDQPLSAPHGGCPWAGIPHSMRARGLQPGAGCPGVAAGHLLRRTRTDSSCKSLRTGPPGCRQRFQAQLLRRVLQLACDARALQRARASQHRGGRARTTRAARAQLQNDTHAEDAVPPAGSHARLVARQPRRSAREPAPPRRECRGT